MAASKRGLHAVANVGAPAPPTGKRGLHAVANVGWASFRGRRGLHAVANIGAAALFLGRRGLHAVANVTPPIAASTRGDALVLVDVNGHNLAFLEPDVLTVTRRWCGGATVEATLDVRDPKTSRIVPGSTALQWWWDENLRFQGQVGEPLTCDAANVAVKAADPWDTLGARKLQADETYNEDAGAIALASLATENARATTRLAPGTVHPTTVRSTTFKAGTTRADVVTQLAQLDGGFGFTLDPVEGVPGTMAALNIYGVSEVSGLGGDGTAAVRDDLPAVRFEYGEGTLDNCDGFTEEIARPRNRIIATGQALPDGTRPQRVAEDTASQDEYGLWEFEVSVNTTDTAVLYAHALAELRPEPIATYSLSPTPEAPLLFRDFDVGNTVRLTIKHGRVDVTGSARVDAATMTRDSSGPHTSALTLSSPLVPRIATRGVDLLPRLLGSYRDRIALLERARVVGS